MENIFQEVYEEFKQRKDEPGVKAFNVLDRELVQSIIVDGSTYWFEWTSYVNDADINALREVKAMLNKRGLTYLYG